MVLLRSMPSVCYRHLFQSTYRRFCWATRHTEAFLFWEVFALFNCILSGDGGGGLARSILALTGLRVRTYS
jgi:hypothetical protein